MWNKQVSDAVLAAITAMIVAALAMAFYAHRIYWALVLTCVGVVAFSLVLYLHYRVSHFYRRMAGACFGLLLLSLAIPGFRALGLLREDSAFLIMFESLGTTAFIGLCVLFVVTIIICAVKENYQGKNLTKGTSKSGDEPNHTIKHKISDLWKTWKTWKTQKSGTGSTKKTKPRSLAGQQVEEEVVRGQLQAIGFEEGREESLTLDKYRHNVKTLLAYTRDNLCSDQQACILRGTAISLPSAMMVPKLMLYHRIWKQHARLIEPLRSRDVDRDIRLICNAHKDLRTDIEHHKSRYEDFFNWCRETHFDVRLLKKAEDYFPYLQENGIELQDFMVFGHGFAYGSRNPITDKLIECEIVISRDRLLNYEEVLEELSEDQWSIVVKSVKDLGDYLSYFLDSD